jgi:hypothetical protein
MIGKVYAIRGQILSSTFLPTVQSESLIVLLIHFCFLFLLKWTVKIELALLQCTVHGREFRSYLLCPYYISKRETWQFVVEGEAKNLLCKKRQGIIFYLLVFHPLD